MRIPSTIIHNARNSCRVTELSRKQPSIRRVHQLRSYACAPLDLISNDGSAQRQRLGALESVLNDLGDLCGQSFLNLQSFGESLDYARQLGNSDHSSIWHIGYPCPADYWRNVVLAMALEGYSTQNDHFIISIRLLECRRKELRRIGGISREVFFERSCETCGGLEQSSAVRIVASPTDQCSYGLFGIEPGRTPPASSAALARHSGGDHVHTHRSFYAMRARPALASPGRHSLPAK